LGLFYRDFKRANGYSELEIASKRQAIENVLITDSQQTQLPATQMIHLKILPIVQV
jgi:tRNA (cmo5U34)-methyltransferase